MLKVRRIISDALYALAKRIEPVEQSPAAADDGIYFDIETREEADETWVHLFATRTLIEADEVVDYFRARHPHTPIRVIACHRDNLIWDAIDKVIKEDATQY